MSSTPHLVVGAGASGLAAARALDAQDLPFEVVERHDGLGGLWDIDNPGTPLYESAHFISSRTESALDGLAMPDSYPDYPDHTQVLRYLRDYAAVHDLARHVRLGTRVCRAAPADDGSWEVVLDDGTGEHTARYAGLICASGNFWTPNVPELPGPWDGEAYHSVDYRDVDQLRGRRVLIVGAGNTGCDLACDAAVAADHVSVSVRRGYRIVPKHLFGIPVDVIQNRGPHLPGRAAQAVFRRLIDTAVGDLSDTGWPAPDHEVLASHPIVNTRIIDHLRHGAVTPRPDVAALDGATVRFTDGTAADFDLVIWATGYRVAFPYLDADLFDWRGNDPDLFLNVFHRRRDDLAALGIIETNGGAFPHISLQAKLVARVLADQRRDRRQAAAFRRLKQTRPDLSGGIRHVDSARHDYYVEFAAYRRYCRRLLARMRRGELDGRGVPTGLERVVEGLGGVPDGVARLARRAVGRAAR